MHIPEDFAQVNLQFTGECAPTGAETTFGVASTSATPLEVAAFVFDAVVDSDLMETFDTGLVLANIHVKVGPNETGAFGDLAAGLPGGTSGSALTPNTALLVKKLTATGGRSGAGRMFWPGVPEGTVTDNGSVPGGALATIQTRFDDFFDYMTDHFVPLVLLHAEASLSPYLITALSVQPTAATQRRRLRR